LKAEEFISILNEKYKRPWYAFWKPELESIYQIPDFLNRKLKKHLIVLLDEAHEANTDVLEWLRVLNDQIEKMSIVLSGLPNFEDQLRNNLETFAKRITAKAELLSLTKEETKELIAKRIQYAGGKGDEIPDSVISSVYDYTGGFPREVIRICDELVNNAIMKGKTNIEFDLHEKREERAIEPVSASMLDKFTHMQKEILEMLSKKPLTPGQIANSIDLTKNKSRQHAVRSVNNVMKALHEDGYLERRKEEKAYVYSLLPRISTLFVKR
jgi:Cdc6-like AAA superfamily ATPase